MTKEQRLLIRLIEECGEVIQECTRALTFGIDSINTAPTITNRDALDFEINDVVSVLRLLAECGTIPSESTNYRVEQKIIKIKHAMGRARVYGVLTE